METILQGLNDLDGVQGAFVCNEHGAILGWRSRTSIFDESLYSRVSGSIVKVAETIQLQQPDWEMITGYFNDGRILICNVGRAVLAVVADATLNTAFAGVAIRVAVVKLKDALANPQPPAASAPAFGQSNPALGATAGKQLEMSNPHGLAGSGLLQSGMSWSGGKSSMTSASAIAVADAASSHFLDVCVKALAHSVGPMAKVYIKEAVRTVSPAAPFSRELAKQLVAELERHITTAEDRRAFRKQISG